jgi:hypothetical protein
MLCGTRQDRLMVAFRFTRSGFVFALFPSGFEARSGFVFAFKIGSIVIDGN